MSEPLEAKRSDAEIAEQVTMGLHAKLGVETERADRLQRQNTEYIAEIRKLRLAQDRVALQVEVLRKVARLLRNEVKI